MSKLLKKGTLYKVYGARRVDPKTICLMVAGAFLNVLDEKIVFEIFFDKHRLEIEILSNEPLIEVKIIGNLDELNKLFGSLGYQIVE